MTAYIGNIPLASPMYLGAIPVTRLYQGATLIFPASLAREETPAEPKAEPIEPKAEAE